ncbi:GlcG/HbpS family heme-binding protein [Sphingobium fuliginis]|uniref:Heme-binding protein n=1 Tax=Sphingobium fuliginis ATCC 27551 TaxID=1208342 RepID=A0A5B8CL89_SPHSA|nr:heme-binding protein [Sphingobium fuliginis]QDC37751.1 heme-binding protein [Sphingobium fuliginis ATCC 27551]
MTRINQAQAKTIIEGAFAKGKELGLKPLSVAVLDPGGHLIAFERADGASLMRYQIAAGKAAGALALGLSSRKIGEMAIERPTFLASLGSVAPAGIIPAAGGVIVVNGSGEPLGAVGVTGDTSDNDELCTIAGIEAAGLAPQS